MQGNMANSSASPVTADRNDPCPCGSGKKFKKCCIDKVAVNKPAAPALNIGLTLQQAAAALNAGRLDIAEAALANVLRAQPDNADAFNLAAYIYFQRRQYDTAVGYINKAISLNNKNGLYFFTASLIAKAQRKFDEMEQLLLKALQLKPAGYISQIYSNLGDCMHEKRNLTAAINYFSKAIEADTKNAKAYFYRAMATYDLDGLSNKVESDAQYAMTLAPNDIDMLCKMGALYSLKHEFEKGYPLLKKAVALRPDSEEALFSYATCLQERGNIDEATTVFQELLAKHPQSIRANIGNAFLFPTISQSYEQIDHWRSHFEQCMQDMIDRGFIVHEPERQGFYLPFYQSYHGRDNTELNRKMADFFARICPATQFTAPHCKSKPQANKVIRVGFVSDTFHSPLLTQFFGEIIKGLAKDEQFEVLIFAYSARRASDVDTLSSAVHKYVTLPIALPTVQQLIAKEEIDILIYLDIGMRLPTYLLAFARLAHIQAVMGGHPITTGIPNVDYFFTTGSMEPEGAQAHYTEKLLICAEMLAVFKKKYVPEVSMTRAELGLPEGDLRLYTCPVLLFKLHPDMDKIFAGILQKDDKARILLFDSGKIVWRQELEKRFLASMGQEFAARIIFIPFAPGDKFIHTMRAMDAIFDTLHFSFGTTAFQLLGSEIPFVTKPGEFLRGRGAYGLFKMIDMLEMSADTVDGYVDLIIKLANDKAFYKNAQDKIRIGIPRIFDNYEPVEEFKGHIKRIYMESTQ